MAGDLLEDDMRKFALALAAFAAVAFVTPATTNPAQAETIIIKKKDRGHHYGWRHARAKKVIVIKEKRRHHRHWN
jgi:hypothetical protein